MSLRTLVFDAWTALSHKESIGEDGRRRGDYRPPSWVGPENERRLAAYTVLRAYVDNAARAALRAYGLAEDERSEHREYGDAALIVSTVADAVLGDEVQIVVDGADVEPPPAPELPEAPEDPGPDADDVARRIFDIQQRRRDTEAAAAIDEWEQQLVDHPAALERQAWLREWADQEQLILALLEVEHEDIAALGDGVFALGWSATKRRPVVDVYDPGFYFPVLDPVRRDRFPRRVHVAWEYEQDVDGTTKHFVHRITWELRDLDTPRRYPWQAADEDLSSTACFMTEATWPLERLDGQVVDDFSPQGAVYAANEDGVEIRDLDLGVDFIPVVHVPCTPARKEHFGRSVLAHVAQLLDEIQAADTDLAKAARKAGFPVLALSGAGGVSTTNGDGPAVEEVVTYGPGTVFKIGQGKMDVLDMSAALAALREYGDWLLDRLSTNRQLPAEVLGRVKAAPNVAGITVALLFGPLQRVVRMMRLARNEKYPLIPKFAQRFAQVGGALPAGENPRAEFTFGSFLPSDQTAVIEHVVRLLEVHGVSRLTTLRWLVDAGLDIGDLAEELRRIDAEDLEAANRLLDATGDEPLVRRRIGVPGDGPRPPAPPPPVPALPPVPGSEENPPTPAPPTGP